MRKLPIYKYLDISTAHITKETDEFILKQLSRKTEGLLIIYDTGYGYFINVPYNLDEIEMHIPNDLASCLGFAKKHSCRWLLLDCYADVVDELEQFEW